jgi:hypothetical protein
MTRTEHDENVLAAFAVEPLHDKATLDRYLTAYPDLRTAFLDLIIELEFDAHDESPLDLESAMVSHSWHRFADTSPERLTASAFTRDVATALAVKTTVVMQLRDRAVRVASIPLGFMSKLAKALGTGVAELTEYLSEPRSLATGASYKADGKPTLAPQMELTDLLAQCGHSPEEIAQLVDEA